jgi:hypothetical protein
MASRYDVHRSGGPHYPDLLSGVSRETAERFAIAESAADPEGRTFVITNAETWKIAAEYRLGQLRADRPRDARARAAC